MVNIRFCDNPVYCVVYNNGKSNDGYAGQQQGDEH